MRGRARLLAAPLLALGLAGAAPLGAAPGAALPSGGKVQVLLELDGEPLARVWARTLEARGVAGRPGASARAAAGAAVARQASVLEARQAEVLARATAPAIGGEVIYAVERAYNGIALRVDAEKLASLRAIPGVRAVRPLVLHVPDNAVSVPFIGVPTGAWQAFGVTGKGIRIGIIDTGVDYLHGDFGGSGSAADYQANDRTKAPDAYFPTARVVGGWDFAGDDYDGNGAPKPDPDPMDCNGHGTHVAGIAAGQGVTSGGAAFRGPWDASVPFADLAIGPGAAPEASLYALRVFGCGGSTALTIQAIDWAIDPNGDKDFSDHLDVVNMSLGSPGGATDDATSEAADAAGAAGVIVVASAGNEGDTAFVSGSPGASARAISVAASTARGAAVRVTAPQGAAGLYPAGDALFGPRIPADGLAGPVVATVPADACSAVTNGAALAGKLALVDRGTCSFVQKVKAAQDAGATGVVVVNNTTAAPEIITMAGSDPSVTIPSAFVRQGDGATMKAALGNGLSAALLTAGDTLASFSSRGPVRGPGGPYPKPDVTAPGQSIVSALSGITAGSAGIQVNAGSQSTTLSGTSMSSPLVAGVMALLRQRHPGWSVAELKALVMSTASHDTSPLPPGGSPPVYGPSRVGAGRVDAAEAASGEVIAFSEADPVRVGLLFQVEPSEPLAVSKAITVVNKGSSAVTLDPSFVQAAPLPGVTLELLPADRFTLGPGERRSLEVKLSVPDPRAVPHPLDPTMSATQSSAVAPSSRSWASEASGWAVLTGAPSGTLRVPVHAYVRGASSMRAAPSLGIVGDGAGTFSLPLSGSDLAVEAAPPAAVTSTASAFELAPTTPTDGTGPTAIRYVGVASDVPAKGVADGRVFFAVATKAPWTTPGEVEVKVEVDRDGDGKVDAVVRSMDTGSLTNLVEPGSDASPTDVFVAFTAHDSPAFVQGTSRYLNLDPLVRDTALDFSDVVVLPAPAGGTGLDLTAGTTRFRYRVRTTSVDTGTGDATGWLTYDPGRPGLAVDGTLDGPFVDDRNGATVTGRYDIPALTANGSAGLLVLHHHNRTGERAQVVRLRNSAPAVVIDQPGEGAVLDPGAAVAFAGTATDPDAGDTVTYSWSFGDGGSASGAAATHAYHAPGTYPVTLTASDLTGAVATASVTVTVRSVDGLGPQLLLPVVLDVHGGGGSHYTTEATLSSRAAAPVPVFLVYTASRGTGSGIVRVELAPGETRIFRDVIAFLREQGLPVVDEGAGIVGTLRAVFSGAPAGEVFVGGRTSTPGGGGTFGLFYAAADATTTTAVVPGLQQNASTRSNLALVNLGPDPVTLRVALAGPLGEELGSLPDVVLPGWGWQQLDRPLEGKAASGRATVTRVAGGSPFSAYGVLNDAVTSDGSYLPPVLPGGTGPADRTIPVVLDVSGLGGSHYTTEVTLANLSAAPLDLTLAYTAARDFGTGSGEVPLTLAAGEQRVIPAVIDFLRGHGLQIPAGGVNVAGSLAVKAPAGTPASSLAVGARTFTPAASGGGTFGVYYPGLTAEEAASSAAWVEGLQQDAATRSNLAAVNLGDGGDPVTLRFRFYDASGAELSPVEEKTLAPGEWLQLSQPLGSRGATSGRVHVERLSGTSRFLAYGVLNDAATSDGSYLPMTR